MKNNRLTLEQIKDNSFVTTLNDQHEIQIRGGYFNDPKKPDKPIDPPNDPGDPGDPD